MPQVTIVCFAALEIKNADFVIGNGNVQEFDLLEKWYDAFCNGFFVKD